MAKVLFVKTVPNKKRIQLGTLSDGVESTYSISESTYTALGCPTAGTEIDEKDLGTVRFDDECNRALKRAASYLSASDKSRYALRIKLIKTGFSAEAIDTALDRLHALGYLDESRQLDRAVEKEANYNLRGKYYIRRKLLSKGYSYSDISRAIERLTDSGEVDFDSNLEILFEKKGASSDEEREALKYKFGYKT